MAVADVHRFSTDEFLAIDGLPRRVELLHGVIHDMSPEGPAHARAQRDVAAALTDSLPEMDVLSGGSVRVSDSFCPIPDVAVYRRGAGEGEVAFDGRDAVLIVEVGVSSAWTDRTQKLPAYADGEVAEVWLIAPEAATMACFRAPHEGRYTDEVELPWPGGLATAVQSLVSRLES